MVHCLNLTCSLPSLK
uniref:Uncharacterized protein n=1 Tax=Anguilla anguilla TaxID=7936 RepID=A0A0E9PWU4_ANGAN